MNKKRIYTNQEIAKMVSFFPNWNQFRRISSHKSMTRQIVSENRINEFFPGNRRTESSHDINGLKLLVDTFESIIAFLTAYPSVYAYIYNKDLKNEVYSEKHYLPVPATQEQKESLLERAKAFLTQAECNKADHDLFLELGRFDLLVTAYPPHTRSLRADSLRRYSLDKLKALVAKYPSLTEFHAKHRRQYEYILAHGMQAEVYPVGYSTEHTTDGEIVRALKAASAASSVKEIESSYPFLSDYLEDRGMSLEKVVGKPLRPILKRLNSLRIKRQLRDDVKKAS